jgi:hypothetical protein
MTLSVTFKEKSAMWLAKYSTSKEKKNNSNYLD